MKTTEMAPKNMDEYIAGFPKDVQRILHKVRQTIRKAAPDAEETLKYQIPTFTFNGNLISFAAYKKHIGLYPVPAGTAKFQKELSVYRAAKSTVRLQLDKPIPFDLIGQLVKFRVKENSARAAAKAKKRY